MRRILTTLVFIPLVAFGQPHVRGLSDQERVTQVPPTVASVQDRQAIQTFLDERKRHQDAFLVRAMTECPRLLSGAISSEQFAEHVDAEDAAMYRDIDDAYSRLQARLSPQGRAELSDAQAKIVGQASDEPSVSILSRNHDAVSRVYRLRCEEGLPASDPNRELIDMGPGATERATAPPRVIHPDPSVTNPMIP